MFLFSFLKNLVINAQLPAEEAELIADIVFPEDYHTQIFIPANAIIHQRYTEGKWKTLSKLILNQ